MSSVFNSSLNRETPDWYRRVFARATRRLQYPSLICQGIAWSPWTESVNSGCEVYFWFWGNSCFSTVAWDTSRKAVIISCIDVYTGGWTGPTDSDENYRNSCIILNEQKFYTLKPRRCACWNRSITVFDDSTWAMARDAAMNAMMRRTLFIMFNERLFQFFL